MSSSDVEVIEADGLVLCYLIHHTIQPTQTTFITPPDARQQVGFIVYPEGGVVKRHVHRPLERHLIGMSEVLFVKAGRCRLDLYDAAQAHVASRELVTGDVVVLTGGGHGLHILEDTVLLEIKQGPYLGQDDKTLF